MAGVEITFSLDGLTGTLSHGPSGSVVKTTPPVDIGGDGSSFSPTDLLAASLLSCAVTTMALSAGREKLDWFGASGRVIKHMVGPPRKVGELTLEITLPARIREEHRARLETFGRECPVAKSLSADVKVPLTFKYV